MDSPPTYYKAEPIFSFTGDTTAVAWNFRPLDPVEKPQIGTTKPTSSRTNQDMMRCTRAAQDTLTRQDLADTREVLVGFKVVPGSPGARLVGGTWRYMPQATSKPLDDTAPGAYADCFGPVGGGKYPSGYYGRKYDN